MKITKSDAAAGTYFKGVRPAPRPYTDFKSKNQEFSITFKDDNNKPVKFYFVLPPAVENPTQYTPGGNLKGYSSVPEVKPGSILDTTVKAIATIVPGGKPIIQTIGISSTTYMFTGMITGGEKIDDNSVNYFNKTNSSEIQINPLPSWDKKETAFDIALKFDTEIVQKCRPVTLKIVTDTYYVYEGIIVQFKPYFVRADKVYYLLNLLGTKYPGRTTR